MTIFCHYSQGHDHTEMEESIEVTVENRTASQESDFFEILDPRLWPSVVDREAREPPAREVNASIQTLTNEAISIEFYNPQETRSKTRKIIPARKRARKDTDSNGDTTHTGAFMFTGRDGNRGTWMEEMAWLIAELKSTISTQTKAIEALKTGQEELKQEQRKVAAQNETLRGEIRSLRVQIKSPSPSWATVVATPSTTPSQLARANIQGNKENTLRITTPLLPSDPNTDNTNLTRYMEAPQASSLITEALKKDTSTQDAQVAGVGTTKTGYLVRFKDKAAKEIASKSKQWLEELGSGVKLVKPRFGIVVHRTPTDEVRLREDKERSINKIVSENDLASRGFGIEEIAWLKKKDSPLGAAASLGIWFDSAEAAEWAIQDGMLFGLRYVGSVEPYKRKERRCFNCQGLGHEAWSCKERQRCGHCAAEHDKRECPPGLRKVIGDRFNDLSTMLGGRTQRGSKITAKELNAVLDFAEQSGKFRNRDQELDNPNSG